MVAADAGSQPKPYIPTWALASTICSSVTAKTTPLQISSAEALFQIYRAGYLNRRCAGVRGEIASRQVRIKLVDYRLVNPAAVPPELLVVEKVRQGIGPGRVYYRHPWDAPYQAQLLELEKHLAERTGVTQIATRDDNPVGHIPAQLLDDAKHNRLLPFEPKRVHRVDKIYPQLAAYVLDLLHTVIEITLYLDSVRPKSIAWLSLPKAILPDPMSTVHFRWQLWA